MNGARAGLVRVSAGTGFNPAGWHALAWTFPATEQDRPTDGFAVCGDLVTVSREYPEFDWVRGGSVCRECVWMLALHAGGRVLDDELARLRVTEFDELPARLAQRIITDDEEGYQPGRGEDYPDHRLVALLVTVAEHTPVALIDEVCAESVCQHTRHGRECPALDWACPACSLRCGSWAGEREGLFFPECLIRPPCQVLRTLAAHYGVPIAPAGPARGGERA